MLVGINLLTFDVGEIEEGDYFVRFKIRNKEDNFKWNLVSVYGVAQQEYNEAFLTELVQLCTKETLTIILGGDFNMIWDQMRKITRIIMIDGLFCLMRLFTHLITGNWQCSVGNLLGQTICKTRP
jgi:hypothetical protein